MPLAHSQTTQEASGEPASPRESLQSAQAAVRAECLRQKITNAQPDFFFSSLIETDSEPLLKAHALFERGTLAFLRKNREAASRDWMECRQILNTVPASGNVWLRRVNLALAQLWMDSLPEKDLAFFQEGLTPITQTIDEAPLPDESAAFRHQLQQEYHLLLAKAVFSAVPLLCAQDVSEAKAAGVLEQKLTEAWSKKALCRLLANEPVNVSKSHEALVDRALFQKAGDNDLHLCQKLLQALQAMPAPAYSDMAVLVSVFNAECNEDKRLTPLLNVALDSPKLDRARFGHLTYLVLKTATGFRVANRIQLLQDLGARLQYAAWPEPALRLDIADWLARAGAHANAAPLLQSLDELPATAPVYPRLVAVRAQIAYLQGDYPKAISEATSLPEKEGAYPPVLYYWKALSHAKLRQNNDAIEALKKFLAQSPAAEEAPEACFFLATLCLSSGKREEAQRYFEQTILVYSGTSYAERAREFARALKK